MKLKNIFLILFLIIALIYITNITAIPNNIVLFEGEDLHLGTIFGIVQKQKPIITVNSNNEESNIVAEEEITLSLFNIIALKSVKVTTIDNTKVIPLRKYSRIKTIFKWRFSNWNDGNRRTKAI